MRAHAHRSKQTLSFFDATRPVEVLVRTWKGFWILAAVVSSLATISAPRASALCVSKGDAAPNFTLKNLNGDSVTLSNHRGKVVFLTFWSSWCSRCKEELEFLKKLRPNARDDLVILAINQESEQTAHHHKAAMAASVAEWEIPFQILLDEDLNIWGQYCLNALPTSVIVDREGNVHFAEPNFYWASVDNITAALQELGVLHN